MVNRARNGVALTLPMAAVLALLAGSAAAAVTFEAALDPPRVPMGRASVLTVTLAAETQDLPEVSLPPLAGADVAAGGTSQQFSMINGAVSVSKTWRWRIRPLGDDDVRIPSLEVRLGGVVHRTAPLILRVDTVGAPGTVIGNGNRTGALPEGSDRPAQDMPGPGDDHFVTLETDRDQAYVGEQIVLTFRYYQALRASGFDRPEYTAPRTEGFWREEMGEPATRRVNRAGVAYQVTEIRYSLVPTRPGDLLVEPARVALPRDPFASFFSRTRRPVGPQELWTSSVEVRVRDLPAPRPRDFSGLVSRDVALAVTLDRDTIPQGEAVSVQIRIQADGSLKSLSAPAWNPPEAFQVHEAGSHVETEVRGGRLRGSYRDERILQPLRAGTFTLPPVELVSFDPARGEYVTTRSAALALVATPSGFQADAGGPGRRNGALPPGEELAFVHAPRGALRRAAPPLPERTLWWALLAAPLVLLAGFRLRLERQDRDRRDPAGRRRRQALDAARARLDAATALTDPAAALGEAAAALRAFVADREGRPPASVDTRAVADHLRSCLGEAEADRARALLDRCAGARFGRLEDAAHDAEQTIVALRQIMEAAAGRGRSSRGAAGVVAVLAFCAVAAGAAAAQTGPDPARLLAEGNQAYTAGDLDTALSRYLAAAAVTEDPDVLYNLGNAHARRGELGAALVCYRRAQRLDPRDSDLRRNAAWVREHAADRDLAAAAAPSPVALVLGTVERLSLDEWAVLLGVLVWALAAGVAVGWWRGEIAPGLRRILLGLAGAVLIVAAVLALRWYDERVVAHAVVVAPKAVLRSGPDESFPEVMQVSDGLELRIEDRREGWCQVGLGGDWRGWLPASALATVRGNPGEAP